MAGRYCADATQAISVGPIVMFVECETPYAQALTAMGRGSDDLLAWSRGSTLASSLLHLRGQGTLACEEIVIHSQEPAELDQLRLGVFVHGLLGTGRNWRTFVRSIAKQAVAESGR